MALRPAGFRAQPSPAATTGTRLRPRALLECVGMCWTCCSWWQWFSLIPLVYLIRCTVFVPSEVLYRYGNRGDKTLIIEVLSVI